MKQLKDLTSDELYDLFKNNKEFNALCYELAYNYSMEQQSIIFNDINCKVFDYHDYYTSFYLTTPMVNGVKAPEQVAHELDETYMNDKSVELYNKLCAKVDEYENMTIDEQETDQGYALYDEACKLCDELAENLTTELREYENIDEQECFDFIYSDINDYSSMGEYETDGEKVYEHITKVYK